jgi:hypothetical protein
LFAAEQVEGYAAPALRERADAFIDATGAIIHHGAPIFA